LKNSGRDIISLSVGEPDFDTPDHIKEAAIDAIRRGETKYPPVLGIVPLREAIAAKFKRENNLDYKASQTIVGTGGKQILFNTFLATCDAGDEVIIPAPYWVSYPDMVIIANGKPVIVPTTLENGFKIKPEDLERAITPRTKWVMLNFPGNPTGAVYTREELEAIGEVALAEDIIILSDEIYEKLTYDDVKHVSIASLSKELYDLTITVNGFSKSYAMTGWRLGYLGAPEAIAKAVDAIQSHSTSGCTSFAQKGALAALKGDQAPVEDMRAEFDIRRQYMVERLTSIPKVKVVAPQGAFYVLADISGFGMNSTNFADRLLGKHHVAVVPGIAFGDDRTIRFSYATSLDIIKKGLDRFEEFCRAL
jgi:aspartate aminotransferase